MAEALAGLGDADEVTESELLAHGREQFEWKIHHGA
jgi:hypothetical protein